MRRPCSWAFQKDSELLSIINYHLVKLREVGILQKLDQRFIHNCNSTRDVFDVSDKYKHEHGPVGLSYEEVNFPFLALLTGLCLALLLAGFERMVHSKMKCMQDEEILKEDESTSEDEKDIIDDIYSLLLENHSKLGGKKFLSKVKTFLTLPETHPSSIYNLPDLSHYTPVLPVLLLRGGRDISQGNFIKRGTLGAKSGGH